jgi:hypothetical protein
VWKLDLSHGCSSVREVGLISKTRDASTLCLIFLAGTFPPRSVLTRLRQLSRALSQTPTLAFSAICMLKKLAHPSVHYKELVQLLTPHSGLFFGCPQYSLSRLRVRDCALSFCTEIVCCTSYCSSVGSRYSFLKSAKRTSRTENVTLKARAYYFMFIFLSSRQGMPEFHSTQTSIRRLC